MFFLTPILAGLMIVGTLGTGVNVEKQAEAVVSSYNLSSIARLLEIYYIDYGSYPESLEDLFEGGEIKNLDPHKYSYVTFEQWQRFTLCEVNSNYCRNSF